MEIFTLRNGCGGGQALAWLLLGLLAAAPALAQSPARPVKLAVEPASTDLRAGTTAAVAVTLWNADNQAAAAPKALKVELVVYQPDGSMTRVPVTIDAGQSSKRVDLPLGDAGIVEVRARQPELLDGGAYLMVHPRETLSPPAPAASPSRPEAIELAPRPPAATAPTETRSARPQAAPGAPRPLSQRLRPQAEMLRARPLTRADMPPSAALASPPPAAAVVEAPSSAPTTVATPSPRPILTLRYGPQGRPILADGKDEATISAFLLGDRPVAPTDLRVRLFNSRGELRPGSPLVIARGKDSAKVVLTSREVGTVEVEYLGSNPPAELEGQTMLSIPFAPPITDLNLRASPPTISLLEQADVVVSLRDASGIPVATDRDRVVSLTIDGGRGILEAKELTISAGHSEARATFLPTGLGAASLTASTPGLMKSTGDLRITMPLLLLSASALGALAGGGLAFLTDRKRKKNYWRILIGLITGFLLYLAAAFLNILPEFNLGAFHPFAVLLVSAVGGWLGTRIFDPIVKRFGIGAEG